MGGKSKPKIDVPDPQDIIDAEMRANRVNTSGPFGSVSWDGNTQRTELSPEMQGLQQRMMGLAMQDSERVEQPDFLRTLAGGMMSNIGNRYGVGGKPGVNQAPPTPGINPQAPDYSQQAMQIRDMLEQRRMK